MAVNIPISANVSGVQDGLNALREALDRSGQSAKALRDIDLSHPELQKFQADLRQIQLQMEQLARIGRGEAAATARQFVAGGNPLFGPSGILGGGVGQQYPNAATAGRVQGQLSGYLLGGTNLPPPAPPPPPPAPPPGLNSMFANAAGMGASAMGPMLGMLGIGALGTMLQKSFDLASQESIAVDTFMRRLGDSGTDFDRLTASLRDATKGLGITSIEATRVAQTFQRMSGEGSAESAVSGGRLATGVARSFGADPDTISAGMGRAQFLGVDPKNFALMLGEAVVRGGQSGQTEEVQSTLIRAAESLNRTLVSGSAITGGMGAFSALYTDINEGASQRGLNGLRGAGAANVLETINRSVMNGGNAGNASLLMNMRAFARAGVTNPYQAQELTEGGMFQTLPGGRQTVVGAEIDEMNREYGDLSQSDPSRYRHIVSREFGISMPMVRALQSIPMIGQNLSGLTGIRGSQIGTAFEHAGVDLTAQSVNPTAMQDLVKIALADQSGLEEARSGFLGRKDITQDERNAVMNANPDNLRDVLLQQTAKAGQVETEGEKTRQALADIKQAFIEVGTPIKDAIVDIEQMLAPILKFKIAIPEWMGGPKATGDEAVDGASPLQAIQKLLGIGFGGGGGGGGGANRAPSLSSAEQNAKIGEAVAKLQQPEYGGFTKQQAAAIAGEAMDEGGMDARAKGDGGTSFGLFQIHNQQFKDYIKQRTGKDVSEMSFDEQLKIPALLMEPGGPLATTGQHFRGTKSAWDASTVLTHEFENPAGALLKAPIRAARAFDIDKSAYPYTPPPDAAAGGSSAAGGTIRTEPLRVDHYVNGQKVLERQLPTFVIPPTPSNAPGSTPGTGPGAAPGIGPRPPAPPIPTPPMPQPGAAALLGQGANMAQ